ncbi:MAG: hypothetical protein U0517_01960 [Candidatus Andersenbacteria bacterium]
MPGERPGPGPEFLGEKYQDLPGSKPVERAVQKELRSGKPGPTTKEGRIESYLGRLERITEDERGYELLKNKLLNKFTINLDDTELVDRIAHGLYESEKKLAIEQGRGADIRRFESEQNVVEHYKPLVKEKAEIQQRTLSNWLDYLQRNDAKQPMSFRYFVVRSLEKMGQFDKERGQYSKRTITTVAPFPELNSEALGWVYQRLTKGLDPDEQYDPAQKAELQKLIKSKDFAKLYAHAQIETAGKLNRESLDGTWKKYDKGSDWRTLEHDLKNKGTGWCTAEGSAKPHLAGGDFFVYYTKGKEGKYTEPRVAIRMEGDHIGEVRGVGARQEVEPALVDAAQAKYHKLPGGESYDKKAHDMKYMTALTKKQAEGKPLTGPDLRFLYELDAPIESFGYDKDPRVAETRKGRDVEQDMLAVFDATPEQIAHQTSEVRSDTKAYVGKLEPGVFELLSKYPTIEHIYTSFPEKPIRIERLETGGKTADQYIKLLEAQGHKIYDYALDMLKSKDFKPATQAQNLELVRLSVGDLMLPEDRQRGYLTTDELYKRADSFGLDLAPAETGPELRLKLKNQPVGEYVYVGMKPITVRDGNPSVFCVERGEDGSWLQRRRCRARQLVGSRPSDRVPSPQVAL